MAPDRGQHNHFGARTVGWAAILLAISAVALLTSGCGAAKSPVLGDEKLLLAIDSPAEPAVSLPFRVAGWAADLSAATGTGIGSVEVYAEGCNGKVLGKASYGSVRSDVAGERGDQFSRSGWQLVVQALPAGEQELGIRALNEEGNALVCEAITVIVSPTPFLSIDEPAPGETLLLPFAVAGWAADLSAADGSGVRRVEVLDGGCQGRLLGEAEYGLERGDVALKYGHQFGRSGWQFVVNGVPAGERELGVHLVGMDETASTCENLPVVVR